MTELAYCDVPGCEDPLDPSFPRPAFRNGKCSTHMKQLQRTGKTSPIAEKLTDEERAIEAGTKMLQAGDENDEYDRHRRAWLQACRALGDKERVESLRKAMAAARERGVRIGRPPKVDTKRVVELVRLLGRTTLVAQVLGVDRRTVYRHLARVTKRKVSSQPSRLAG